MPLPLRLLHRIFNVNFSGVSAHLTKYRLAVVFFLPRPGVITDLCSFYHLPSTVIGNAIHSQLRAALNYYLYNWCCPTLEAEDVGIVLH